MIGEDTRTCDVCGAPVADSLKWFMESLLACNAHLEAWQSSPERRVAILETVRARNASSMREAFAAFVSRVRVDLLLWALADARIQSQAQDAWHFGSNADLTTAEDRLGAWRALWWG